MLRKNIVSNRSNKLISFQPETTTSLAISQQQQLKKGYFHSTIVIHIFRIGFLRPKQYNARAGLSGCGLPPRLTGRFGGAPAVVAAATAATAVAVVDGGAPTPSIFSVLIPVRNRIEEIERKTDKNHAQN